MIPKLGIYLNSYFVTVQTDTIFQAVYITIEVKRFCWYPIEGLTMKNPSIINHCCIDSDIQEVPEQIAHIFVISYFQEYFDYNSWLS